MNIEFDSVRERRLQTVCLAVLATVSIGAALIWLRPVLVPLTLAIFIALLLGSFVDSLQRRLGLSRIPGLLITGLLGFACLLGFGALIASSVQDLASRQDLYSAAAEDLLSRVTDSALWKKLGLTAEFDGQSLAENQAQRIGGYVLKGANSLMSVVSQGVLVAIFTAFLLVGQAVGGQDKDGWWAETIVRVGQYVRTKVFTSGLTGVLTAIVLSSLGVQPALVFGVLAFVLNFVPTIGSIIAVLLPLPMVLVMPEASIGLALLVLVLPGVVQFLVGNVLEPRMLGRSLGLHPITLLVALILWGMLWGVVGMLLAAPLTAVVQILLERQPETRGLAAFLGGRGLSGADEGSPDSVA